MNLSTMTILSKYQSLISALLDATAERRIKWEMTNIPNEFQRNTGTEETQGQVPVSKLTEV